MQEFSTSFLSLGTAIPASPTAPSPGFPTNGAPPPGSPTIGMPSPGSPTDYSGPPSIAPPLSGSPSTQVSSDTPSDIPSLAPSAEPTPTTFQTETVFGCTPGGLQQFSPPYSAISVLSFEFEYLVEALEPFESYKASLESILFVTAVSGALQCSKGTTLLERGALDSVEISTILANEDCASNEDATVPVGVYCYRARTAFEVAVAEDLDSAVAVFLGYIFLRDELDGGILENDVPGIVRGQYLGPLPTLPTNVEEDDDSFDKEPPLSTESRLSVSAWTVGAVVAMCKFQACWKTRVHQLTRLLSAQRLAGCWPLRLGFAIVRQETAVTCI
jgi:hypothetical protein